VSFAPIGRDSTVVRAGRLADNPGMSENRGGWETFVVTAGLLLLLGATALALVLDALLPPGDSSERVERLELSRFYVATFMGLAVPFVRDVRRFAGVLIREAPGPRPT